MSRPQALPIKVSAPAVGVPLVTDRPARAARAATDVDAPIASPVHSLQEQLLRFGEPLEGGESAFPYNEDKAPGWVRVAIPATLSVVLWLGILGVIGVLD